MMLEKRTHAYRTDIADLRLKGQVDAKVFREGSLMQMVGPLATLHRTPSFEGSQETQILFGETIRMFDEADGWAWVQLQRDNYVGYMRRDLLQSKTHHPTHYVCELATQIYSGASIKLQPAKFITLNAGVSVTAVNGQFSEIAGGGFVFTNHLAPMSKPHEDFVAVAERFLHVPYYWGGKSYNGIDCSGLVQSALHACGIACPRDADMQEQEMGHVIERENVQRGDLIFWPGHVGIMLDQETLLHASGYQMLVVSETLAIAEARSLAKGTAIRAMKRL
jgi:cell wall-associated NlpC family hydrolase